MEIRSETDYAQHHIQKVIGFFAAMQNFANEIKQMNHQVIYYNLNDENNLQCFDKNCTALIAKHQFTHFEYQLPDEYRVDEHLKQFTSQLNISFNVVDSEHFYSTRNELKDLFDCRQTLAIRSWLASTEQ
jgi:deoxyribodipyrimidine photolyase-related protein